MKYIFKPKNRIECISRNGDYHGFFTIKNVDIALSAKNTRDLEVLMKFRHKIEEHIVDFLNSKSYKKDYHIKPTMTVVLLIYLFFISCFKNSTNSSIGIE